MVSGEPNRNFQPPRLDWKRHLDSLTTSGSSEATLLLDNLSMGVGVEGTISARDSAANLLRQSVEWIVDDLSKGSSLFPISNLVWLLFRILRQGHRLVRL
jgi:hypothetical protein